MNLMKTLSFACLFIHTTIEESAPSNPLITAKIEYISN
jgi:hypothetical protein